MIPQTLIRIILPKILDHLMQVFKLDKVLNYVELENELDVKVKELESRIKKLES